MTLQKFMVINNSNSVFLLAKTYQILINYYIIIAIIILYRRIR